MKRALAFSSAASQPSAVGWWPSLRLAMPGFEQIRGPAGEATGRSNLQITQSPGRTEPNRWAAVINP